MLNVKQWAFIWHLCVCVCWGGGGGGGWSLSEKKPIITYRETLKVINDLYKLLQVENINE